MCRYRLVPHPTCRLPFASSVSRVDLRRYVQAPFVDGIQLETWIPQARVFFFSFAANDKKDVEQPNSEIMEKYCQIIPESTAISSLQTSKKTGLLWLFLFWRACRCLADL